MTTVASHLLFILEGGEGYGVMRVWDTLLRGLPARGHRVSVLLLRDNAALRARLETQGIDVLHLPVASPSPRGSGRAQKVWALGRRGVAQLGLARRLAREIRARGIDTILLQSPLATMLAALSARWSGTRAFWMMPNSVSSGYPLDLNRRVYRALFRAGPLIPVANSHHTDGTLGPGHYRRHVLHLGIDTDTFCPGAGAGLQSRAALGIPEDAPLLGLMARITPEKGQAELIEAMSLAGGDAHLLLCGGPLESRFAGALREQVASAGLQDRVHFAGPQADVIPWYALCDVVLNTRTDPEPFGLSVIEAMAMGKPVLAHGAGGPSETVIDGETGWLMSAPTAAAYAEGIARALADRPRWAQMGAAATAHAQAHFSENTMLDGLGALLSR
ncbi:glycosyltransferase family 4 protein [Salipiger sp. 1_MG-2023]|uniref:glycosyltransferase family 4 protein n=1 Tax=Salipiger sp. 1_MG-2023 TaxID=3062665 RepID=UPI0026E2A22B|nr:glycosyltransferase family 4 protein [Salipiger sp. 1_MG-2023]MDO6586983.1 glycosyltransferase family 4 protein [Salipiger sp. 1_MG-2023]